MADEEKDPLDLSLEDLLIDDEPAPAAPAIVEEIPPAAFFGRHSVVDKKQEKADKPTEQQPVAEPIAEKEPPVEKQNSVPPGEPESPPKPPLFAGHPVRQKKVRKKATVGQPTPKAPAAPPPEPPQAAPEAPKLPANVDRDALQSKIEKELLDEFQKIMPTLMDQALDHMVEILPVLINEKLTTHMLDYLLENRVRILEESTKGQKK